MSDGRSLANVPVFGLLAAALLVPALAGAAAPGDFDRSLGGDGKVRTSFCYHGGHFASVAIDSHHRIVTAGSGVPRPHAPKRQTRQRVQPR